MVTRDQFEDYCDINPKVYQLFKRFALQYLEVRPRKVGAKMIWERMRWYTHIETKTDEFKLNNNYTAFYARKFCDEFPEYVECFDHRKSAADVDKIFA